MSGSLKRALGLWVASQVDGLHVIADELANRQRRYPACTVTETSHDVRPLGCGKKDHTTRDTETGHVDTTGRLHTENTSFRLLVSAPSNREQAGEEIVAGVVATIEQAVLAASLEGEPLILTDTETDTVESFELDGLTITGRQPVPVDISGEPFIHRGALSLRTTRTVPVATPAEAVIERIHVEGE
jgi:hypothetical protein